jgi:hypothetical protein
VRCSQSPITAGRITAELQQMTILRLAFGSRVSCKSMKIQRKVGSGGRDRTADLGVMKNPEQVAAAHSPSSIAIGSESGWAATATSPAP